MVVPGCDAASASTAMAHRSPGDVTAVRLPVGLVAGVQREGSRLNSFLAQR